MNLFYKLNKKFLTLLFVAYSASNAFSETKLKENKVTEFANEVFLNCTQYAQSAYFELYKRNLNSITIYKSTEISLDNKQINSIKTLALKNKCNSNLTYDDAANFKPENFNPLKYFFPRSEVPLYYKIDGTDYIIKINPF
jgi:hypothetical protein